MSGLGRAHFTSLDEELLMSDIKWWAYLHVNGSVHVKRYFDDQDIRDAWASPFVQRVTYTYEANDREQAIKLAHEKLGVSRE